MSVFFLFEMVGGDVLVAVKHAQHIHCIIIDNEIDASLTIRESPQIRRETSRYARYPISRQRDHFAVDVV
ncbi:hypothetical protein L905_12295 [Agrobacterium sp. TS43]|nr:hypothetical protein L906_07455 [Agrobacterium sp. TS45]KVK66079.1 hypothetical protein L907_07455 [Agrobacterium sp. C13]KVK70127.1 hypothetical protein L905_12295 [Agrobacterium sp. TS43]RKF42838.1 hypothetical protein BCY90_00375 [Agrobacterium deltaense]